MQNEQYPLISIVINCYNGAGYLKEAVESVLNQSYQNWELILWDNQSTDETASIFKSFSDPRLKYFYAPVHTKLGEARNLALEKTSGLWIGFLDSDDLYLPEKLQKQAELILSGDKELGIVYGKMQIIDSTESIEIGGWQKAMLKQTDSSASRQLPEGDVFSKLLNEDLIPLPTALFLKSGFQAVGGIDLELEFAEDLDLFVKLSKKYTVKAVNEVVCYYRIHNNNLSLEYEKNGIEEVITVLSKHLPDRQVERAIRRRKAIYGLIQLKNGKLSGLLYLLKHSLVNLAWVIAFSKVKSRFSLNRKQIGSN